MPNYECKCCCFSTKIKTHYATHLKTMKHKRSTKSQPKVNQESTKNQPNVNQKKAKSFECKYCNKGFTTKQAMYRHIKYRCDQNDDESLKELVRLLNEQKEENKSMQKQIEQLTKKLQISKVSHTNSHNNTMNNSHNQQINYNIQLLNHDKTDYSHLTDRDYVKCIKDVNHCVKTLICKVHFNPLKPENHNIYISNLKSKNIMVYMDGKWKVEDRDTHLTDLFDDNHLVLEEWYAQYKDKYPDIVKSFQRYLKNKNDEDIVNYIKELITKDLYNERDIVEKTKMTIESVSLQNDVIMTSPSNELDKHE